MTAVTARASFVIFKDEPSSPVDVSKENSTSSAASTTILTIVTARDKENLHPVTGRQSSTENTAVKKPKTSALATKLLKASGKGTTESRSSSKKRRLAVASDPNCPSEEKEPKKEKRSSSIPRKHKAKPSIRARKITELPKVEEEEHVVEEVAEQDISQAEAETSQAAVDSKCYDLTVLPLADVSKAYEQSPPPEEKLVEGSEEPEVSQKEDLVKPVIADDKPVRGTSKPPLAKTPPKRKVGMFSTPERKRIYAAFTFESPSPAAKRYAQSRGSSMDRFSDLDFDPLTDAISIRAP